ncbi:MULTISPECIES: topoisomerase DNA-binding C4 zinc finger domain-containing protein [Stenotrophomonas]|uniref:topoisomerase DNA-binding C4 zinc finger domain-containing protein n=2 Tax=Lysobacteraceae TaxID=32033 RepID=UPI002DBAC11E|nr:topoisomerase DNA-binding C4 zinc finger domain-containing protein [Stenotrophomonas pavanii]MCU1136839.1 topoisomerase DNA-binding C4 zinc finger domain-containing protein [Stenotrophomonas maltophilia]MEC4339832.1 topoisomerase DNA-binding C4 zinc finger domain-containing protein [Stenotrophomonas pavanii]
MRRYIAYAGLALCLATAWRWLAGRPFADGTSLMEMATMVALLVGAGLSLCAIAHTCPSCPRCRADMRRRYARRGRRWRRVFWGCVRYPTCQGTRQTFL